MGARDLRNRLILSISLIIPALALYGCPDPDPVFLPEEVYDGSLIVSDPAALESYAINLRTGEVVKRFDGAFADVLGDGTAIVVRGTRLEHVAADGSFLRLILQSNTDDQVRFNDGFRNPQVSHDGTMIAYEGISEYDVFVINFQSGEFIASVGPETPSGPGFARPSWRPNGELVVTGESLGGSSAYDGIWLIESDFSAINRIDDGLIYPRYARVSPDGNRVAFTIDGDPYVMNIDGSQVRRLDTAPDDESWPAWSPDGKWIATSESVNKRASFYPVDGGESYYIDRAAGPTRNFALAQMEWVD